MSYVDRTDLCFGVELSGFSSESGSAGGVAGTIKCDCEGEPPNPFRMGMYLSLYSYLASLLSLPALPGDRELCHALRFGWLE